MEKTSRKRILSVTIKRMVDECTHIRDAAMGEDCYLGVEAQAEIQTVSDCVQRVHSGGLWGIDPKSDAPYFADVANEQLSALRDELRGLGFGTRAIAAAFKKIDYSRYYHGTTA